MTFVLATERSLRSLAAVGDVALADERDMSQVRPGVQTPHQVELSPVIGHLADCGLW
jgi:hypothetical protein